MASISAAPPIVRERGKRMTIQPKDLQAAREKAGTHFMEAFALMDMLRVIGFISLLMSAVIAIDPTHAILMWMRNHSMAFHPQVLINLFLLCGLFGVLATKKWRYGVLATAAMLPFAFLVWQVAHYLIDTREHPPLFTIAIDISFLFILAMWYMRGHLTREYFEQNVQLVQENQRNAALIQALQAELTDLKALKTGEAKSSAYPS